MSYMPCRHGRDEQAHLYVDSEPDRSLCGKSVAETTPEPGDRPACPDCAKRLLVGIFRHHRRISSIDIVVHD
jgi:hypothetical protein